MNTRMWHKITAHLGRGYIPKFKSGDRIFSKTHGAGFVYDMYSEYTLKDHCFHEEYACCFDSERNKFVYVHKYAIVPYNDGVVAGKNWQWKVVPRVSYGRGDGTESWAEHHRPGGIYCNHGNYIPYTGR